MTQLTCGVLCLCALSPFALNADLLYDGSFDEVIGTTLPAGWESTQPEGLSVGIATGSLSYPGLATSGNKWELDNFRLDSTTLTNKYTDTPLSSGQTVFFSFLLKVAIAPTGSSPSGIMRLGSSAGGNDVAAIGFGPASDPDNPTNFQLSVDGQHRGFSNADSVKIGFFDLNETILIVGSYTYGSGTSASFWINPDPLDLGALAAPTADYVDPSHSNRPIDQFEIGFSGQSQVPGSWFLDEFRIGSSWADVTPVPEPSTYAFMLGCGAIGFAALRRRRAS